MYLLAQVSASPSDERYDGLASVYCHDPKRNYCFSLSRHPDSSEIEVMVVDQVFQRVRELEVVLSPKGFRARLSAEVAAKLDGEAEYKVEFLGKNLQPFSIEEAMQAVFRGKPGLSLVKESQLTFEVGN
jgi:hypothetical protein